MEKSSNDIELIMNSTSNPGTKVAIAMSGGVDSSVAAAILVDQGYDVIGIMLRLWSEPGQESYNRCCTSDAMAMAKKVAAQLDIPFYPIDAKNVFYEGVVQPFISDYSLGVTPNPCLRCNKHIRWEFMLDHALAFGADLMATGHYARIDKSSERVGLLKARDRNKDQSYVLHVLDQEQLSRAIFPLGEYRKDEVRQLAVEYGLPVAAREDSQDLCFLGDSDYRDFLNRNSNKPIEKGNITNLEGDIISEHRGLAMYTIGQRRGLGVSSSSPLYVIEKDRERNTLVIGSGSALYKDKLWAKEVNWTSISEPSQPLRAQVKIRYKSAEEPALIKPLGENEVEVQFDNPIRDITPGQAAVFYDGDTCLGGGIIKRSA